MADTAHGDVVEQGREDLARLTPRTPEQLCRDAVTAAVWAAAKQAAGMPAAGSRQWHSWRADTDRMKELHRQTLHFAHACALPLHRWVDSARAAGVSWTEVGEVMGVSRQAAQQRYGRHDLPVDQLLVALVKLAAARKVGTYTTVGAGVGLPRHSPLWPRTLAAVANRSGVRLDVLVVADKTGLPGAGFYTAMGLPETASDSQRRKIFQAEKAKVFAAYASRNRPKP